MPKIPTFIARGELGVLRLPRPTAESFGAEGFQALGELGAEIQKQNERWQDERDRIAAIEVRTDASRLIEDTILELEKEPDHRTHFSRYEAQEKIVRGFVAQEVKSRAMGPQTGKVLEAEMDMMLGRARSRVLKRERELTVLHERSAAIKELSDLTRQAARAGTREESETLAELGRRRIEALVRGGAMNAFEGVRLREGYDEGIRKSRAEFFDTELEERVTEIRNRATREPENAPEYMRQGLREIERAAGDWLPEEKKAEAVRKFQTTLWHGAVLTSIDQDPDRTLKEIGEGHYDKVLTQQSLISLRNVAEAEIERRRRLAEAERKERERQIGKFVSDYEDAKMRGHEWRGPVSETRLADLVKGTEHEAKFLNVTGASGALAKFKQLPPIAQEEALRRMRQGAKTGFEAKFLGILERAHEATRRGLESDPLSFAVGQRVVPPPPPLNLQDPASLRERSRLAGIVEQHYGRPVSPLSDDEVEQLRITIDKAPADGKALILRWLKTGFEDRQIKAIAGQLAKKKEDNVLALAIGISAEAPQTASRILQGREILKDNPKINPSGVDLATARERINEQMGEAYMHNPEHHAAVSQAAMALYAQRSWQERDLSGAYNRSRMDEAIKEASGGLISISRGFLRGSYRIQPPRPGMSEEQFLGMVKRADYSKAKGLKAQDIQRHGIFESIGDGRYLIRVGPGYVQSDKGPFILDLSRK